MTIAKKSVKEPPIPWAETTPEFDKLWESSDASNYVPDILSTMFVKQEQQMEAYREISHTTHRVKPKSYGNLESPIIQAKIREYVGYTIEELLGEAISGHLKNKPWKQELKEVDREAFLEELADAWHFFIEMHIYAGITPEEVFRAYFAKALENNNRRTGGY